MFREELSEKFGNKLKQEMNGPLYEIFAKIMREIVGKKITVPGSFKKYVFMTLLYSQLANVNNIVVLVEETISVL